MMKARQQQSVGITERTENHPGPSHHPPPAMLRSPAPFEKKMRLGGLPLGAGRRMSLEGIMRD